LNDTSFTVYGSAKGYRLTEGDRITYDSLHFLYGYPGKRIIDIVNKTNLYSVNLFAEGLLHLVGYQKNRYGSTNSGLSAVYKFWSGKIDLGGFSLKDGSGLSRKNAVSASHFCQLLKHVYYSSIYADFKGSLSVAGKSGTLKYVCRGQKGANKIFAKSGTLSNVKAYSGYVQTESGKNLAFAVIANNFTCSKSQIVKKMELIFNAMAAY
jgi:D-alanyl-D-alanine carboxypeptidase/D-alanyl-D-alanine-endopeptidase (penicillin-binding protein 4)